MEDRKERKALPPSSKICMCTIAILMQVQRKRDASTRDTQVQTHALLSPAPHWNTVMEMVISGH